MRVLVLVLLVACQRSHDVQILFGPTEDTISIGFRCVDQNDELLVARARTGNRVQFALRADIIDLGDHFLGCRGEELLTSCSNGECSYAEQKCKVITIDNVTSFDVPYLVGEMQKQLSDFELTDNAPDSPVIVRLAIHRLKVPVDPAAECPTDLGEPLGCAHSCPVQLDDVDKVSVSLGTLTNKCEAAVGVCAEFPRN